VFNRRCLRKGFVTVDAIELSGFGDEIADDPALQLDTLLALGIRQLDVRGARGKNVLAFDDAEARALQLALDERGMTVSCVSSPIGKAPVDGPFAQQLRGLERMLTLADLFGTRFVRVFSYFIPDGDDPARHREEVLRRVGRLARRAEQAGIVLLHENEERIYGDTPERCHDLLQAIGSPCLRAVWDPANFVYNGVRPHDDAYALLRPWIAAAHVKDAVAATGEIVVPGRGDAQWRETLPALLASGFSGPFTYEPHLQVAGPFGGFTGPELYGEAVAAFNALLAEAQPTVAAAPPQPGR
jgi:sugar phosphate isomerase/epimerase